MDIKKNTDELLKILEYQDSVKDYITENKDEIFDCDLSLFLNDMLEKYGISKGDAVNASELDQIYGYQIFSGVKKNPSRDKLIQLIFGMKLKPQDAQRLLKIGGVRELYPRIKRDSIIIFALNKGLSITECDELLFEMKEKTIINE